MPGETINRTALLDRMERQAQAINGPGMGTSIKHRELRGMLDIIHAQEAELAQIRRSSAREARRAAPVSDLGALDLDDLTAEGLRKIAERRGVDLGNTKAKAAMITMIEAVPGLPAPELDDVEVVVGEATVDFTGDLIRVFVEIFERHPELWGSTLMEALDAWDAQSGDPTPAEWRDAIKAALADG